MFAPNRLVTVKEQWLLVGIIAAVLVGSVVLYLHGRSDAGGVYVSGAATSVDATPVTPVAQADTAPAAATPPPPPAPALAAAPAQETDTPSTSPEPDAPVVVLQPELIGVAVMGAVRRPGFYMTPADYRVNDLVALAGGATEDADLSELLLTAPLLDEATLTIPEKPVAVVEGDRISARRRGATYLLNPPQYLKRPVYAATTPPVAATGSPTASGMAAGTVSAPSMAAVQHGNDGSLNLNLATDAQLQQLPGIGPVLAGAIIAERERQPFMSVDDLQRVHGIGEKRVAAIRTLVTAP